MNIIDTIKANPQGVTKAVFALATAAISLWFLLVGKPDQAITVTDQLAALVIPISTVLGFAFAAVSALHFSRGPVPTRAIPIVTESVTEAKIDGTLPIDKSKSARNV